jgi:phytanoyl-CoA hydroxylase
MSEVSDFYKENGYYVARGIYSPAEVKELERDFDRTVQQLMRSNEAINARWSGPEMEQLGAQATSVLHTHNIHQFSAAWHRAFLQDKFLAATEQILGPDIVLHHSKLFQKPSETGAPFPMHQDWTYFPTIKDTMMAAVIHVSDATDQMGCFRVYPGTHKLGRIAGTSGKIASDMLKKYPLSGSTPLEAKAGDVVFFHYFLLHGSNPNTSDKVRKTVLVQMYSGDDHVEEGNAHINERLMLKGWNHHVTRSQANRAK